MYYKWKTERNLGVDDHLGVFVGRQPYRVGPTIASIFDTAQIALDDIGELTLLRPYHGQLHYLALATLVRIVEENLGTVGVEPLRGQGMLYANFLFQDLDGGTDPLERHAGSTEAREYEGLCETDERNSCLSPSRRETGDQWMLCILGASPPVNGRLGDVKKGRGLAQGEEGIGDPRVVAAEPRVPARLADGLPPP